MICDLTGLTAIVTGAGTGIGRGVSVALAGSGARVIVVARRKELLDQLVDELPGGADQHQVVVADLSTTDGVERVLEVAAAEKIDIVVHNAGVSVPAPPGTADAIWENTLALQFHAPRRISEALLAGMASRGYGRIVLVGATFEPMDTPNASTSAKAALAVWAKGLSNGVAADGITVNTVVPGRIKSEQILTRLHADPEERAAFIQARIPIKRFGEPHEFAQLVTFLASPMADYITGAVIPVDGGMRRYAF